MNWGLVFLLSLFGLAMAIGTVFVIPSNLEPFFWLGIFLICAYLIATRSSGKYFLHGLAVGIANSVWITAAHVLLFDQYIEHHPKEAAMMATSPIPGRLMMACVGPLIGVVSGLVLGLFAVIAGKLLGARRQP
jgi:hypothetical protein